MENAPGQLLGYSTQFPRALSRLLQVGPQGAVGIEVLGDVSAYFPEGLKISEEDKSSISRNPLSNRSTDLWKTFYNWIRSVENGEIEYSSTKFVIYTNKSGRPGIVNKFSEAQNDSEAKLAIEVAKTELNDIEEDHAIWEYYNYVINTNPNTLISIIKNFELQIGKDSGYNEIERELARIQIPKGYITYISNNLCGWIQRVVNERIANRKPAVITFEEYSREFSNIYHRARLKELIDFASQSPPEPESISSQIKLRPIYIQQLELLELEEPDILDAVNDYLRADYNRTKWIENEILDEFTAADFESKLKSFWINQNKEVSLIESSRTKADQGKLILLRCQNRQIQIAGQDPPDRTVHGTYHALADKKEVGWHPEWISKLTSRSAKDGTVS